MIRKDPMQGHEEISCYWLNAIDLLVFFAQWIRRQIEALDNSTNEIKYDNLLSEEEKHESMECKLALSAMGFVYL